MSKKWYLTDGKNYLFIQDNGALAKELDLGDANPTSWMLYKTKKQALSDIPSLVKLGYENVIVCEADLEAY